MADRDRPNILILYADQHRADTMGFENAQVKTPNLDRLAAQGTAFSNCYCQYPVCTPSRMSLLTGQYVHTHGCHSNNAGLHPHAPLFPRILREHGYRTAGIGKLHFYPVYAPFGLDHLELAEQNGNGCFEDDYHHWLASRGALDLVDLVDQRGEFRRFAGPEYWETFGAQASNLPEELHSTTWIGDRSVAFLENVEPPFCLWTGFVKPHHPFDPPAAWLRLYDEDALEPLPGWTESIQEQDADKHGYFDFGPLTAKTLRRVRAHYFATISHIDAQIGRILQVLERRGLCDTIVIYHSDHGDLLGYHHLISKGDYLYDPLVRVPLIVTRCGESGWQAGRRSDALVESIDVTSSILDAAGIEPPRAMQGQSLLPILEGRRDHHREVAFSQNGTMRSMMLRTQEWKLVQSAEPRDRMLFDLAHDPTELHNLFDAPEHAAVRHDLEQRLLAHLCGHYRPLPFEWDTRGFRGATSKDYLARMHQSRDENPWFRGRTPYADRCGRKLTEFESEHDHDKE